MTPPKKTSGQIKHPQQVLVDFAPLKLQLVESAGGKVVVRGEFAKCGVATENKRVYPGKVWEKEIKRLNKALSERGVFGELDHPADGRTQLTRVSHVITSLGIENGIVVGEAEIVGTDRGKTLQALLNANCRVGVSSRGYGSTVESEDGTLTVQDDYRLATFDFVAEPADGDAFPAVVSESVEYAHGKAFFEGVEIMDPDLEAELADKFAARIEADRKGTEEKVKLSMREELTQHVLALAADSKATLREQLRGEMLSDPAIGAAKKALDEIKALLLPLLLPEETEGLLRQRDLDIKRLQKEGAEHNIALKNAEDDNAKLAELARTLGYRVHVETTLSGNPDAASARKMIGDVALFKTSSDLKTRLQEVITELASQRSKTDLSEEKKVSTEISSLKASLQDTHSKLKKLTEALEKSMEANELLQMEKGDLEDLNKDLEVSNKDLEVKLYAEQQLTTHPKAGKIKKHIAAAAPKTTAAVDKLIESFEETPQRDAVDGDSIRARVRARLNGGGQSSTPRDEETPRRLNEDILGVGVSIGDFNALAGNRSRS